MNWINVNDRKPQLGERVLCYTEKGKYLFSKTSIDGKGLIKFAHDSVTHWQELVKPPEDTTPPNYWVLEYIESQNMAGLFEVRHTGDIVTQIYFSEEDLKNKWAYKNVTVLELAERYAKQNNLKLNNN